ncbi:MAG: ABC transporter ATP-binding protein [Anaerolineae bacterium]
MITVLNIQHAYQDVRVLRGINLDIVSGEILCLLGPSGCGKTTLLRLIAGLEPVSQGDILINGQSVVSLPVHQRDFGFMFQDFALFPHMDVAANIAFGLKMQHISTPEQKQRVFEMLNLVNLDGFERRDVAQLSGGERQRVALARSLAPSPRLLMLDEPLGSLDASLRSELIVELRQIIKKIGLTAIYVTHDQREAFAIADRIALMNNGRIEQLAMPQTLYQRPSTVFAASFLGLDNILPVISQHGEVIETPIGKFSTLGDNAHSILLHPDGLHFALEPTAISLNVVISESVYQGEYYRIRVRHDSGVMLTFKHTPSLGSFPAVGTSIDLNISPGSVIPLAG